MKMNFLNPGHENFYELWRPHGSSKKQGFMGNHGPSKNTVYSRYAIIAWPSALSVKNALEFFNTEAAIDALKTQKPIDDDALGDTMTKIQAELEENQSNPKPISSGFCRALCEVLVVVGNVAFVNEFFQKLFSKFYTRLQDKYCVVPILATMLRSLDWSEIGPAVVESLRQLDHQTSMEIGLLVSNELDDGDTKNALTHLGLEEAAQLSDFKLCSAKCMEQLWKVALCSDDSNAFNTFAAKVAKLEPSSLDVATQAFIQRRNEIDTKGSKFATFFVGDARRRVP